jgi:hypothetical protein
MLTTPGLAWRSTASANMTKGESKQSGSILMRGRLVSASRSAAPPMILNGRRLDIAPPVWNRSVR